MITYHICKKQKALEKSKQWLSSKGRDIVSLELDRLFDQMIDGLWVVMEFPYVDKLYRDTYYHYYNRKTLKYSRDCLRLSFFSKSLELSEFRIEDNFEKLQESFLGFIVVRPLMKCLGRNIISPKALRKRGYFIRATSREILLNGVKLTASGFPHASQDSAVTTCSETVLWAVLDYYGNTYPEHSPLLPSDISEILQDKREIANVPSSGLSIKNIAYILARRGFRPYTLKNFTADLQFGITFSSIINCYVESGIPVIMSVKSKKTLAYHAVLAVGRTYIDQSELAIVLNDKNKIKDFDSAKRELIIMDDNFPPYQRALLENPRSYSSEEFRSSYVDQIIVPLPKKVFLNARLAKQVAISFLLDWDHSFPIGTSDVFFRCFLTSSKSLLINLNKNPTLSLNIKDYIAAISLPRYVWMVEISEGEQLNNKLCDGFLLLDATEADPWNFRPIIMMIYKDTMIIKDPDYPDCFNEDEIKITPFKMYQGNLTQYK